MVLTEVDVAEEVAVGEVERAEAVAERGGARLGAQPLDAAVRRAVAPSGQRAQQRRVRALQLDAALVEQSCLLCGRAHATRCAHRDDHRH